MKNKKRFEGIMVPMVTPLNDQQQIDFEAVEQLIEHMLKGGVHGIFILGTTGEATSLSYAHRKALIQHTGPLLANRIPFWVGISDTATTELLDLADFAAANGADAVVAAPPYYVPMQQKELQQYYTYIANHVAMPLYLYNYPSLTKVEIATETVKKLSEHPNIWGLKDSSGYLPYLEELLAFKLPNDFNWLVGPEELLFESLSMGAHGGVNGGANLFPSLYVGAYEAHCQKDTKKSLAYKQLIDQVGAKIYRGVYPDGSFLKGLKAALALEGLCQNILTHPFDAYSKTIQEEIGAAVAEIQNQMAAIK